MTTPPSSSTDALEKRIGKEWAEPNRYVDFPEPIIVEFKGMPHNPDWTWERALCPVKRCTYEGLPHGFNQHYARKHAPNQWRQHAKRVLKVVTP